MRRLLQLKRYFLAHRSQEGMPCHGGYAGNDQSHQEMDGVGRKHGQVFTVLLQGGMGEAG